ncbi:hypothetical protein MSAN_00753900 [Mycena sanguinolenta]|uniref:F-box domain-containing protein n=1 Tax=Mycena sanguinolenta TaxID=230812 RepID=A0A8H7DD86_9AGAR|nr:hypothetical protein MSAN_00753900 [Mycena sanguinolenta]
MLLYSNEVPLDSDLPLIKSEISKIDASCDSVNEEIVQLHLRLKQLEAERDRLSSYRVQKCAILSPLRRMPPEILAEIFSLTRPNVVIPSRRRSGYSPWFLTHVSRRWREIAVSTSSLWSLVVIDDHGDMDSAYSYPVPMLETQIARAQNLRIHFYGHALFDSHRQVEIFQYLAQYASRWEELYLYSSSGSPLLADLRDTIDPPVAIDFVESAPSLVDVSIINGTFPVPISLPADQLTRYELNAPWETHRGILALAPNLVEAHIDVRFRDESWSDTDVIIDLPALNRLFISHSEVLQHIRAPVLQELALSVELTHRLSIAAELEAFLSHSSCTLRRLCLRRCCSSDTTIAILKSIPSLIELRIMVPVYDGFDEETLMLNLTVHGVASDLIVAPQLSAIYFGTTRHSFRFTSGCRAYVKMVKSRWISPECALSRAMLMTNLTPDLDTIKDLQLLRQEGMEFRSFAQDDALSLLASWVYSRQPRLVDM